MSTFTVMDYRSVTRRNINDVLADAQARLPRVTPAEALAAMRDGATLVDTRSNDQRLQDGIIPDALHVPLSVLEWRVDAASGYPSPALAGRTDRMILICKDGYSSSLAALRLRELGFADTTDVIGGFVAWTAARLPVVSVDSRPSVFGAATVIVRGGEVLLVHHTYGELNWELPGGGADPGESAEEAARREALEEVGVRLTIERMSGVYWEPQGAFGHHHFVFRAAVAPGSPEPRAADLREISECGWFPLDALPRPMSDFTARRIDDALSDRPAAVFVVTERKWLR
jgi:8-oxo-dGTP pyrophosphatase MutT (NUDIX family)/rhodanese-related sulfurtransferase